MAERIDVLEMFKQAAFEVDNRRLPDLKALTCRSPRWAWTRWP